ncbi:MAG: hypothetical protein DBY35_02760 [Bacteroidales bacterium]|nr:MAG: hypothetical protein DBY35_02760 [Bacteroidales bacterium]
MTMKKLSSIIASVILATTAAAGQTIVITNLPYAEGKIYLAIADGNTTLEAKALDVESDSVTTHIDLTGHEGRQLMFQAFQDLNDNHTLDFDNFGRPSEPCLQEKIKISPKTQKISLTLKQY